MQCWHKDGGYIDHEYCPPPGATSVSQANGKSGLRAQEGGMSGCLGTRAAGGARIPCRDPL